MSAMTGKAVDFMAMASLEAFIAPHVGDREVGENSMASGMKRSNDQLIRFPVPLCAALFAATEASSGRLDVAFATLDKTLISLRKCIGNWVSY
jgi:hypothetical protein